MKVNLLAYKNNIPLLMSSLDRYKDKSSIEIITELGPAIHCPLIVLSYYVLYLKGYDESVAQLRQRLIEFYKYSNIEGEDQLEEIFKEFV